MKAGQPATWRLTVTNDGPSVADNVVISDNVPDGMSYISAEIEGGGACPPPEQYNTADGDTETIVRCPVETIPAGESVSALITFDVDRDVAGQDLCNAALVGSGSLDPDATDNESQACGTPVLPEADLVAEAVADTPEVNVGREASFTVTVRNDGPDSVWDTTATLTIPSGLTDVTVEILLADGTTAPAECTADWVCTVGDLEPGEEATFRVTGTTRGEPGDLLELTVTGDHAGTEVDPENNTASATVILTAPPPTDVQITISPEAQTRQPGDQAEFTVTIRNNGPELATDVRAVLEFELGLTNQSGVLVSKPAESTAPYRLAAGSLICDCGALEPGQEVVYAVTATVTGAPGQTLTVTGTVTHGEDDLVEPNDTDYDQVNVVALPSPPTEPPIAEPPPFPAPPAGVPPSEPLPVTGADVLGTLAVAFGALLLGTGLLAARRLRTR